MSPYRGKTKYGMGTYTRTPEQDKALKWCLDNDICITPRAIKYGERIWVIDIEKGKYPNRKLLGTSDPYGPNTIWEKVSEYQLYYYKKYAKEIL
tara:strand:- start:323 stop:604 length:282 start_codon:yes stop_codon:yes gene_type:complete